jgi:hypothetical protein
VKQKFNYYNIHNLVKIKTNFKSLPISSYFLAQYLPSVNLNVELSNLCLQFNNKTSFFGFFNLDDGIYFEAPYIKAKLLVRGIDKVKTDIYFNRSYLKLIKIKMGKITTLNDLLFNILQIKLLQNEHSLLYSSCITKGSNAVIFVSPPHGGKSFTANLAIKHLHFQPMSDDKSIIDGKGYVYANPADAALVPSFIQFIDHNFNFKKVQMIKIHLLKYYEHLSKAVMILPSPISIADKISAPLFYRQLGTEIVDKAKVRLIIFQEEGDKPSVEQMNDDIALLKLLTLNRILFNYHSDYLIQAYSYFNPSFKIDELMKKEKEIFKELLKNKKECLLIRGNINERIKMIIKILLNCPYL